MKRYIKSTNDIGIDVNRLKSELKDAVVKFCSRFNKKYEIIREEDINVYDREDDERIAIRVEIKLDDDTFYRINLETLASKLNKIIQQYDSDAKFEIATIDDVGVPGYGTLVSFIRKTAEILKISINNGEYEYEGEFGLYQCLSCTKWLISLAESNKDIYYTICELFTGFKNGTIYWSNWSVEGIVDNFLLGVYLSAFPSHNRTYGKTVSFDKNKISDIAYDETKFNPVSIAITYLGQQNRF